MHSIEAVEQFVTQLNNRFLFFHDRHFRKYLTSGRLVSALVSTAVVADIPTVRPLIRRKAEGKSSRQFANIWKSVQNCTPGV
jgi:hypothetical protein